jgi:hypothetical protein
MKERYMAEQVNKEMQIISKATVILILSEWIKVTLILIYDM